MEEPCLFFLYHFFLCNELILGWLGINYLFLAKNLGEEKYQPAKEPLR